ncbi:TerC family protein [Kurthia sibirica]|uniref:TerC family protein n=1 Tax=Kurthia sibirica TaxID=202750 RepID=A0A2U3APP5_9BACL|nr:TerC family protein [Kurthia sibirica]PWI26486.1 hypothetical protein DEX24_03915 [Kurthia sibirica]GEK33055.1 membrane protein [Kurthia sibirica]
MDIDFLYKVLSIIILDIVLSGDNAVVIALATRKLKPEQRKKAILIGTGGAIVLRIVLTVIAVQILAIPFVKLIGGLLLFYIAWDLLKSNGEDSDIKGGSTLMAAVRTIIIADFVMSLDNVLAIAGVADGHIGLAVLGLIISIPIIIFGSQIIIKIMDRFPIVIWIGALLIAFTAGSMVVEDKYGSYLVDWTFPFMSKIIPILFCIVLLLLGLWTKKLQARNI